MANNSACAFTATCGRKKNTTLPMNSFTKCTAIVPRHAWLLIGISILATTPDLQSQKFRSLEKAMHQPEAVVELQLRRDKLESVPPEIAQMTNLEILDLSKNKLRELPGFLAQLPRLHTLILSKNQLTKFPLQFACDSLPCPPLCSLIIDRNPIDSLPEEISKFRHLQHLDLWHTELEYISPQIAETPELRSLDVSYTYFKTADLVWLREAMPQLELRSSYGCKCD